MFKDTNYLAKSFKRKLINVSLRQCFVLNFLVKYNLEAIEDIRNASRNSLGNDKKHNRTFHVKRSN